MIRITTVAAPKTILRTPIVGAKKLFAAVPITLLRGSFVRRSGKGLTQRLGTVWDFGWVFLPGSYFLNSEILFSDPHSSRRYCRGMGQIDQFLVKERL